MINPDPLAIVLTWCRAHSAAIRYRRDGSVTIRVGRVSSRAQTLVEAWSGAVEAVGGHRPRRRTRQMEIMW